MRQRFQSGVGGRLVFYPREALLHGPPSSASVSIKSARGIDLPTPVANAAAVIDPVNTTIAADVSQGEASIVLTSVVGVTPSRRYLISCADGERFEVEVAGVNAATKAVLLYERLPRDLATLDAFQGLEVSYALAGAQCPDPLTYGAGVGMYAPTVEAQAGVEGQGSSTPLFRAAWSCTFAGVATPADQLYEVHRRLLLPTLTADQVERRLPARWSDLSDQGPRAIQKAIEDTWDDLLDDLQKKDFNPDRVMDADRLCHAHRTLVLATLATTWGPDWKDWAKERAADYVADLTDALSSGDWYEKVEDSVQGQGETKWPSISMSR